MAKKLGRFFLFSVLAGAAAAGTYYFLKERKNEELFEDSEPDVNDELEQFLNEETVSAPGVSSSREYVPLNFSREALQDAEKEEVSEEPAPEPEPESEPEPEPVKEPAPEPAKADTSGNNIEVSLEDTAEKVSGETEKIIGSPAEEVKSNVEKASDPVVENDRISTFSFSSFE